MRVIAGLCSKLVISREFSATNRKMTSTFVHSFEKRTDEHKFSAFDVGYGIYLAPEAGFLSIFSPVVRTREKIKCVYLTREIMTEYTLYPRPLFKLCMLYEAPF